MTPGYGIWEAVARDAIATYKAQGWRAACLRHHIGKSTLYTWIKHYEHK